MWHEEGRSGLGQGEEPRDWLVWRGGRALSQCTRREGMGSADCLGDPVPTKTIMRLLLLLLGLQRTRARPGQRDGGRSACRSKLRYNWWYELALEKRKGRWCLVLSSNSWAVSSRPSCGAILLGLVGKSGGSLWLLAFLLQEGCVGQGLGQKAP